MSKRMSNHTLDERIEAVLRVIESRRPVKTITKEYSVAGDTVNSWVRKYQENGVEGLKESMTWKRYSNELKLRAVEFYLHGAGSLKTTCKKYNISSDSVLYRWIKLYTSGKELKSASKGSGTMTKGRKKYTSRAN